MKQVKPRDSLILVARLMIGFVAGCGAFVMGELIAMKTQMDAGVHTVSRVLSTVLGCAGFCLGLYSVGACRRLPSKHSLSRIAVTMLGAIAASAVVAILISQFDYSQSVGSKVSIIALGGVFTGGIPCWFIVGRLTSRASP